MKKYLSVIVVIILSVLLYACQEGSTTTTPLTTTETTTIPTTLTTKPWVYQPANTDNSISEQVDLYDNTYNIGLFVTIDPTTSIGINFELPSEGKGYVDYKTVGSDDKISIESTYKSTLVGKKTLNHHEALLLNLLPDTTYEYRVRDEEGTQISDVYRFKTKSVNPSEFSFLLLADPQENSSLGYMAYSHSIMTVMDEINQTPDFMMFVGDIVNDADIRSEWNYFFTYSSPFIYNIPIMATVGNHDVGRVTDTRMTNLEFDGYFNLPNNGPTYKPFSDISEDLRPTDFDNGKTYSFDYDNTHFIAINSETLCDGTTACSLKDAANVEILKQWLVDDLTTNEMKWTIVFLHRGPYTLSYDTIMIREELVPIFEQFDVDLVVSGHDHQYSRSIYNEGSMIPFNRSDDYLKGTQSLITSNEVDYHFNDYDTSIGVTYLVGNTSGTKFYGGVRSSGIDVHYEFLDKHVVIPQIMITDDYIKVTSYGLERASQFQVEVDDIYILETFYLRKQQ